MFRANLLLGLRIRVDREITTCYNHAPKSRSGGSVVRIWDQEICSFCGLRFEPCGCSYDDHWRLTWSLTSGPVGLVEVHAS